MKRTLAVLLAVLCTTAAFAGDGSIRRAGRAVKGQYIVSFGKPDGSNLEQKVADVVRVHGGVVRAIWHRLPFAGFSIGGLNEAAAEAISRDPRVEYVEEDAAGGLLNVGWALDRIDQRYLPLDGQALGATDCQAGGDVRVYVVDSGINHIADFGTRVEDGWKIPAFADYSDTENHGTSVASIIGGSTWGAARGVQLVNVKAADASYGLSVSDIVSAVDWINGDADSHPGPKIVNISLYATATSYSSIDSAILGSVQTHNLTYVVGAGNGVVENGVAHPISTCSAGAPAHLGQNDGVITVSATNSSDQRSDHPTGDGVMGPWSANNGRCVDIFAPGTLVDAKDRNGNDVKFSGTSAATPYVTGVAARYLSNDWAAGRGFIDTPAQVESYVKSAGTAGVIDPSTIDTGLTGGETSPNLLLWEFHARCRAF